MLPRCTYGPGYLSSNLTENSLVLLQVVFTPVLRLLLFREQSLGWLQNLLVLGANVVSYGLCVCLVALLKGKPLLPQFYSALLSFDSATLVLNTLLFNIAVSYTIKAVLTKGWLKLGEVGSTRQRQLCDAYRIDEDKQIIRQLFRSVENINPNILEIMNDANIDYNSIKFDRQLEFKHTPLNYKFNFENQTQNEQLKTKVYLLMTVCLGVQLLCSLQEENWEVTPSLVYYACSLVVLLVIFAFDHFCQSLRRFASKALAAWVMLLSAGIIAQHRAYPIQKYISWLCLLALILSEIGELRLFTLMGLMVVVCVATVIAVYSASNELVGQFLLIVLAIGTAALNFEEYRS